MDQDWESFKKQLPELLVVVFFAIGITLLILYLNHSSLFFTPKNYRYKVEVVHCNSEKKEIIYCTAKFRLTINNKSGRFGNAVPVFEADGIDIKLNICDYTVLSKEEIK